MNIRHMATALFITLAGICTAHAVSLDTIAQRLAATGCYRCDATFEVLMPNRSEPVAYEVRLQSSTAADGDTLAPANYLIQWLLPTPDGTGQGFSAYYDGNHFRYRDMRLSEYHVADNPMPFVPRGRAADGVQMQAQFASLLPQWLGGQFAAMAADSSYIYTIDPRVLHDGRELIGIKGRQRVYGYDGMLFTYLLDPATYMPVMIELDSNPDQICEQIVTVRYATPAADGCTTLTEDALRDMFPDIFEKYREDHFSLSNLPGRRLPAFTAPQPGAERYVHAASARFDAPTVIALLDSDVATTPDVLAALRGALSTLPANAHLIMAFVNNDVATIRHITGAVGRSETLLTSARGLARDCGANATPVILICRPDATVTDVIIGDNNKLADDVMQKVALITQ